MSVPSWPGPMTRAAHHGLVGEFVRTVEPHSEADAAALIVSYLVGFGNAVGRGPGFQVEGDVHGANLYAIVVGETSKGRKGTSWGRARQVLALADPEWAAARIVSGLSSGEGVVHAVRDAVIVERTPRTKTERVEADAAGRNVVIEEHDPGVSDKRLLVVESEFASALRVMRREGNILSPTLRNVWDGGDVGTLTKGSPTRTTGAHVSIIGHITAAELRRELTTTDAGNGFANRFLYVCARRSQSLPFGGDLADDDLERLGLLTADALGHARERRGLDMSTAARRTWSEAYSGQLAVSHTGLLGSVTSRSEAQALRLAVVFALLDNAKTIEAEHIAAALAVWDYCTRSAAHVFGRTTGDTDADKALEAIASAESGVTRNELRDAFRRNWPARRLDDALGVLLDGKLIVEVAEQTGGRPATRYVATGGRDTAYSASAPDATNDDDAPAGGAFRPNRVTASPHGSQNGGAAPNGSPVTDVVDLVNKGEAPALAADKSAHFTRDARKPDPCRCDGPLPAPDPDDGELRCAGCGCPTGKWS